MYRTARIPTSFDAPLAVVLGPGLVDNGHLDPVLCICPNATIATDAAATDGNGGIYIGYTAASFRTGSLPVRSTGVAGHASVEQLIAAR